MDSSGSFGNSGPTTREDGSGKTMPCAETRAIRDLIDPDRPAGSRLERPASSPRDSGPPRPIVSSVRMPRSPTPSMARTVLLYGIVGGLLIAGLKFIEYRYLLLAHSLEIYGGIIAVIFSAVGI